MVTIHLELTTSDGKITFVAEGEDDFEVSKKGLNFLQKFTGQHRLVLNHLVEGQKIRAIKLLRQFYGVGLKEGKDLVDKTEKGSEIRLNLLYPYQVNDFEGVFQTVFTA